MKVTAHLHTILQRQTPDGLVDRIELEMQPGSDLTDLLDELGIQMNPESMLLVVNGRIAKIDQQLNEGDEVNLMPAISGGDGTQISKVYDRSQKADCYPRKTTCAP